MFTRFFIATATVALVVACGASESSNGAGTSSSTTATSADGACDAAKRRALECAGDAARSTTGEKDCNAARCLLANFRDGAALAEKMATRECDEDADDFIEASVQTHLDDPGVRDFIDACRTKAAKPPSEGGCNDPDKHSFGGDCSYYAAVTDEARAALAKCNQRATCAEFEACYRAVFEACGNWH